MNENKNLIKAMLGLDQAPTPVQTVSSVIGGLLFGGGLLGALNPNNQQKTYSQATRGTQELVNQILPANEARNKEAQAGLMADLAGYTAKTEASVKQGLINRGITDPNIGAGAAGQVKAGLSGAYAMAADTLARAKLNATSAVSGALSTYKQALAQKQYESMVSKYYAKMGLWSALGGIGGSMLLNETEKPEIKPSIIPPQRPPIGTDERGSV